MFRFFIALLSLASSFLFPWWVTLCIVAYGSFQFPFFVEGIVAGFLIDLQYATHPLLGTSAILTIVCAVLCFGMRIIRRHVRYEAFSSS
jgi:hypothetical protein